MEKIRLQKFFTDAGVMSRRAAEKEIIDGRVRVNGLIAQLGDRVDPELDTVEYKGKTIPDRSGELTYIIVIILVFSPGWLVPIPRGKINARLNAVFCASIRKLAHNIPLSVFIWGILYTVLRIF